MQINEFDFGVTKGGESVKAVTINNENGGEFTLINRGATITSFKFKNRDGLLEELTLGYKTLKEYEDNRTFYGATIGRVGNRIGNATFNLDGVEYKLTKNDGNNSLHGGVKGFDTVIWDYEIFQTDSSAGLICKYLSKDMEENFPGNLECEVKFTLTADNEFTIEYKAVTDKKTPVNLTNHAYWNLSGFNENIHNHNFLIEADSYLTVTEDLIPTGELKDVEGTPFNFKTLRKIESQIVENGGFDHNFNLSTTKKDKPENRMYVEDPTSGRCMELLTTEPGVQIYTGFEDHNFFCCETQMFPNSVNQENFQSCILNPGEVYHHKTVHKFTVK